MSNTIIPIQSSFVQELAKDWIDSWNAHDLERILDHYDDDVTLISPVALKLLGNSAVGGKSALRVYFSKGLEAYPDLRFELIETLWGTETIVLCYRNNVRGSKTAEVLRFNPGGKITHVWANYDA